MRVSCFCKASPDKEENYTSLVNRSFETEIKVNLCEAENPIKDRLFPPVFGFTAIYRDSLWVIDGLQQVI